MFIALRHDRFSAIFGAAQVPKNQVALGLDAGVTHVDVHFNGFGSTSILSIPSGIKHVLLSDPRPQRAEA